MSRGHLGLNASEIWLRNYISQNHHTSWYGSRSTSPLTKRDSLGTLTPPYFQLVLACGSIQVNQGKNGRTSITSPTLSSSLTSLSTARSVQYPSSYSQDSPEFSLSLRAKRMDEPPQHDKINTLKDSCCSATLKAKRAQGKRHLLGHSFLGKIPFMKFTDKMPKKISFFLSNQ